MALLLLIAGTFFGYYKIRMNAIEKQKLLLQQKVNEQTIQLVRLNEDEHTARLEAEQSKIESEEAREEASKANIAL